MKEGDHLEDLDVDGTIIKFISNKMDSRTWSGLIWPRIEKVGGTF